MPAVAAVCNSEQFADGPHCYDPVLGDAAVPFKQLLGEIFFGSGAALVLWLLLACVPRCIAALFAPAAVQRHSTAHGYEEVPLDQLNRVVPEGDEEDTALSDEDPTQPLPVNECRICKEEEEDSGKLIEPCKCRGSMRKVHPECLKSWVQAKAAQMGNGTEIPMHCEVCLEQYDVVLEHTLVCTVERLCSNEAWTEYCNCVLLVCLLPLIFVAMWLSCTQSVGGKEGCKEEGHWTLVAIGVLLNMMFLSTLHKIAVRLWVLFQDVTLVAP